MLDHTDVIDLFAGPGGWSVAAATLGLNELGIEYDQWATATRTAAGFRTIRADVSTLNPANFRARGLIASPPCQAFSVAGGGTGRLYVDDLGVAIDRGDWDARPDPDPRVWLVLEVGRWVDALQPDWIALEQVPGVLPLWERYATRFAAAGYRVWTGCLLAADYGVPQTRERAVLIGHRHRPVTPPTPTHAKDPIPSLFGTPLRWVTMAEALGLDDGTVGFPRRDDTGSSPDGYRERYWRTVDEPAQTVTEKARSWILRTGRARGQRDTDDGCQQIDPTTDPAPTLTGKAGGQWVLSPGLSPSQPNRRLYDATTDPAPTIAFGHDAASWVWTRPATTLACDPRVFQPGGHHQPGQQSQNAIKITPADALALQSFPAGYPVQGSKTKQFEQIGNAIPPLLAWHLLSQLVD